jgi:transcriptional regulator with XRE-family HTH domain
MEQEGTEVALNLFGLKKQLEIRTGRDYTLQEMAEGMGLNYYGLMRAMNGDTQGVQFDTLGKMLDYFRAEGLDVEIGDLFAVGEEAKKRVKSEPANLAFAGAPVG